MLFGVFFYFSSANSVRTVSEENDLCKANVAASLDNIRAIGAYHSSARANLVTSAWEMPTRDIGVVRRDVIWPGQGTGPIPLVDSLNARGLARLNTIPAIVGSIRVLEGLFNDNPGFCGQPFGAQLGSLAGSTPLLVENDGNGKLRSVQTRLKIERYNLRTGARDCTAPVMIRPASSAVTATAQPPAVDEDMVAPLPGSQSETGFWVTVRSDFTDSQNRNRSCQSSALFQYPAIKENFPNDGMQLTFTFNSNSIAACQAVSIGGRLVIDFPPGFRDKGWVPICLDTSSPDLTMTRNCPTGVDVENFNNSTFRWKPCAEVSICGVEPGSARWENGSQRLILTYPHLRWGCRVQVQGNLVDAAYNRRAVAYVSSLASGGMAAIPLPACNICPTNPALGWCPPATQAGVCNPPPPPPPPPPTATPTATPTYTPTPTATYTSTDGDGDGGADGSDQDGAHDGADGDDN